MHSDDDDEDGDEREEDDGVDEDGDGAGVQVAEVDEVAAAGELEQQPRREEHEQHHCDHHRAPVRHPASILLDDPTRSTKDIYIYIDRSLLVAIVLAAASRVLLQNEAEVME